MGKLKIGYRGLDTDGDEFTVVAKAGKGYRDVQYHTGIAAVGIVTERMGNDYLLGGGPVANDNASISPEISVKAYSGDAAGNNWVPKVGDRVRLLVDNLAADRGALATVTADYDGSFVEVKWDRDGRDQMQGDGGYFIESLEPVVAPATTTPTTWAPVVGKFGKTRDGRRVGPYAPAFGGIWRVGSDHDTAVFEDGRRNRNHETPHDLVAEWVEPAAEPVAVAPATATPTQPERKFKVGDVVEIVSGYIESKQGHIGRQFTIARNLGDYAGEQSWGGELGSPSAPYRWRDSELRLAPTLPIGSQVTITATGRLSAINENGHYQVTFPGLPSGRNSFALPAAHVAAA